MKKDGLFPCEAEIARRLSQTPEEWRGKSVVLERLGLPKVDPVMGGRPWRAVLAFFDRRYGVASLPPVQSDEGVNYDAFR